VAKITHLIRLNVTTGAEYRKKDNDLKIEKWDDLGESQQPVNSGVLTSQQEEKFQELLKQLREAKAQKQEEIRQQLESQKKINEEEQRMQRTQQGIQRQQESQQPLNNRMAAVARQQMLQRQQRYASKHDMAQSPPMQQAPQIKRNGLQTKSGSMRNAEAPSTAQLQQQQGKLVDLSMPDLAKLAALLRPLCGVQGRSRM
jgi:exonuclease VII large subunit